MDEAQADLPRARSSRSRVVAREAVLPLLEGADLSPEDVEVVFICGDVDVAMDSGGQRFIACAHPSHGHAPRYAELARRMAAIRRTLGNPEQACRICGGSGWLSIHSGAAHQQYALMRAIGFFRGVPIPQLARELRVQRSTDDTGDHSMSVVR